MENCINVSSTNNECSKNEITNVAKKSNGEYFSSVLKKTIMGKRSIIDKKDAIITEDSSIEINSDNLEKLEAVANIFSIEEMKRVDSAVERLASFFGIGKHLMLAILEYLHIDPEDLLNPAKRKDIVKALAKKFGLTKERKDALLELITEF